jgi:hypothetical protein
MSKAGFSNDDERFVQMESNERESNDNADEHTSLLPQTIAYRNSNHNAKPFRSPFKSDQHDNLDPAPIQVAEEFNEVDLRYNPSVSPQEADATFHLKFKQILSSAATKRGMQIKLHTTKGMWIGRADVVTF